MKSRNFIVQDNFPRCTHLFFPNRNKIKYLFVLAQSCTHLERIQIEFEDQRLPLHIGAKCCITILFKEASVRCKDMNPVNNYGKTPIHFATKSGHLDICKFIIEKVTLNNPVGIQPINTGSPHFADRSKSRHGKINKSSNYVF